MKIITIIGARPQFIKAAVVSHAFKKNNNIEEKILHTGQHFDKNMSDVFFSELEIPKPTYNLGIGGKHHGAMTGQQLEKIEEVLFIEKPDWVLVYGDTNSTLAGALAAVKLHIPVAHVEAGLRSFDRQMPEEINRILTDHTAELLFAPTETAISNLKNEGLQNKALLVGDVMHDAALFYSDIAQAKSTILSQLNLNENDYVLATLHRAENTDNKQTLKKIVKALQALSEKITIVLPIHPRTVQSLERLSLFDSLKNNIKLIEPVGYLDMVMLEKHAKLIVTDSGGVQKEAFFHQVPCITLRDSTEWTELIDLGWNRLVTLDEIHQLPQICLQAINTQGKNEAPYGIGNSARQIVNILVNK
jgi:UDP-GlcNAc3NAcA epimerase